jgi:hypothetical protein
MKNELRDSHTVEWKDIAEGMSILIEITDSRGNHMASTSVAREQYNKSLLFIRDREFIGQLSDS